MFKGGYHGRYAVVDLSNKSFRIEQLPDSLAEEYLGGRGIGTKLLFDLQPGKHFREDLTPLCRRF